jgi:poly(A) polymerase
MQITAIEIVKKLQSNGFTAYFAGGCVRDILMQNVPQDYDIVTSATPDQVENLFEKTVPIGKSFGIILAQENEQTFEIATFRSEFGYSDGRRPDAIEFKSPQEDAKRRDFTVNGLFYDPVADKIHDYIDGQKDINAKIIRFIGDPETRIQEDNLRILRAVRFKNNLDFQYHPETYQAVKKYAHLITNISSERIQSELNKIFKNKNRVKALQDLEDLGLLQILLPEIQALKGVAQPAEYHHGLDVYEHTVNVLKALPEEADLSLVWAALFHDSGKATTFQVRQDRIHFDGHALESSKIVTQVLNRLNSPRNFTEKVAWLCEHHMTLVQIQEMPKAAKIRWFLKPYFLDLLELHKADANGINLNDNGLYDQLLTEYRYEMSLRPDELPKLLTGTEIIALTGIPAGPKIKNLVDQIQDLQYEGKIQTKKQAEEWLLKECK